MCRWAPNLEFTQFGAHFFWPEFTYIFIFFSAVVINDNIQIVSMWLSEEQTSVLDNALITMEHLYKSGTVNIHLRRLMNEQSYFEINYTIDRIQGQEINNRQEVKRTLSMADVDDHKRQLIFCKVDVEQNKRYKESVIKGQLELLQIVEKIYSNLIKLELSGHPDYQLHEEQYTIDLQFSKNNRFYQLNSFLIFVIFF